jgi:hypothetical protein
MPQPRSKRNSEPEPEPEPEEPEAREDDTSEEEFGDDPSAGANSLNIDVADDRVIIELPRDGNERPALEAIGAMLESMR